METVGKVLDLTKEFNFEWTIENFFSLSDEYGKCYSSPNFSFADEIWHLEIYPNGNYFLPVSEGYVSVYLIRNLSGPPKSVLYSVALKTYDGKRYGEDQTKNVFTEAGGYGWPQLVNRSKISKNKFQLVPSGSLTIICVIDYYSKSSKSEGENDTAECSFCEIVLNANYVSSHEEKCSQKPITCPTCQSVFVLAKWFDHKCQMARVEASKKLMEDLENIFLSKEHSYITIQVKGEEFKLHRNILAGRNPVFNSMFKTEMKEKTTGIVSINDCEPGVFQSFIRFIYIGEVDKLSLENVCGLYVIADKYQEDQLKTECVCFITNNMTVNNFCDFISLALTHEDKELLKNGIEFFSKNIKEVIRSVKWQNFVKEHPIQANELYIKAVDYYVK